MQLQTTLDHLSIGESATILSLSFPAAKRRRMLDLGFLPGAKVTALLESPWHDPVAYGIAGAVVALRHEDARLITITGK